MPITVNTNMSSLICQRSLGKATNGMNTALQRMSTGLRINSSKDDAAGMAISSKMDTKLSSYSVAQDNVQMGQSMLDTASGSIDTMTSMLQRMRDLSEQAANGTYGAEERKAMQAEVDALTSEIYRIKNTTEFNGKKILGEEIDKTKDVPPIPPSPILSSTPTIKMSEVDTTKIADYKGQIIGISSAQELAKISAIVNGGQDTTGVTFALTGNIDLSVLGDVDGNGSNWISIGGDNTFNKFQGIFDGNKYSIGNLKINKPAGIMEGLFGYIVGATIQNVNLTNVNVTGKDRIGGLVGYTYNNSTITNCFVEGTVNGTEVNASLGTGGLVGWHSRSTISNCSTIVTVNSENTAGGLVGVSTLSTVTNCSAEGTVKGTIRVGGLVGFNDGYSSITNCFATCAVTGTVNKTGGLVGTSSNSTVSGSYWDTIISHQTTSAGGTGKTTADMKKASTYSGWDTKIWNIKDGEYPILKSQPKPVPPPISNLKTYTKCNLQVGINTDENSVITIDTGFKLSDFKISLATEADALKSIDKIDDLMGKLTDKSLNLGATQNRLSSIKDFQRVQMSALTSASSLIKDADIAKESASYIKSQILQQTTATLLATANQNPSIALSLM